MAFSRKRGRPKNIKPKNDYGTNELRMKKQLGVTTEPIDLCLNKKLITQEEHRAGLRLRWLYTLRFGSPGISAHDPEGSKGHYNKEYDELWLSARHMEYKNALDEINKIGAKRIVVNICIFNQHISFLNKYNYTKAKSCNLNNMRSDYDTFKNGMDVLAQTLGTK